MARPIQYETYFVVHVQDLQKVIFGIFVIFLFCFTREK